MMLRNESDQNEIHAPRFVLTETAKTMLGRNSGRFVVLVLLLPD